MKTTFDPKPCTRCTIRVFRWTHPDTGTVQTDHACPTCSPLLYSVLETCIERYPAPANYSVFVQEAGYAQ